MTLFQYLPEGTEENDEEPQSEQPIYQLRFKTSTSQIKV
jgi:hypothetical protein